MSIINPDHRKINNKLEDKFKLDLLNCPQEFGIIKMLFLQVFSFSCISAQTMAERNVSQCFPKKKRERGSTGN